MSMASLLPWDPPLLNLANPAFGTSQVLSGAGMKAAFIGKVRKAGTIEAIECPVTVTSNGTIDFRLEGASGAAPANPDGTLIATGANHQQALTTADTWAVAVLDTPAAVTRGQVIALVAAWVSGNVTIKNPNLQIESDYYTDYHNGTSWAISNQNGNGMILRYSGGVYEYLPSTYPIKAFNSTTPGSTTEDGNQFQLPYAARCWGFWHYGRAVTDMTVNLYNSARTLLATGSISSSARVNGSTHGRSEGFWSSVDYVDLAANQVYYLTRTFAGSSNAEFTIDVNSADVWDAFPLGQNCYFVTRTAGGGGVFTGTTTRRALLAPRFLGFSDGAGSGGGGARRMWGGF